MFFFFCELSIFIESHLILLLVLQICDLSIQPFYVCFAPVVHAGCFSCHAAPSEDTN